LTEVGDISVGKIIKNVKIKKVNILQPIEENSRIFTIYIQIDL